MKDIESKDYESKNWKSRASFERNKKGLGESLQKIKDAEDIADKEDKRYIQEVEKQFGSLDRPIPSVGEQKTPVDTTHTHTYSQTIRARMARHPERPPEVGDAALSVVDTIATSDQDPNIIAKSIGRIMKFIFKI